MSTTLDALSEEYFVLMLANPSDLNERKTKQGMCSRPISSSKLITYKGDFRVRLVSFDSVLNVVILNCGCDPVL